jgi:hypothetical protein
MASMTSAALAPVVHKTTTSRCAFVPRAFAIAQCQVSPRYLADDARPRDVSLGRAAPGSASIARVRLAVATARSRV